VPSVDVDRRDHVGREVDDLLEVLRSDVEQVADAAWDALEEPDVRDGRGQVDVTHSLATHLLARHLDAAALADDALEADALVLPAVALPVPGRAEDLLAEESVLLGLEGAVVDGLGLLDLAVRPGADVLGSGKSDTQLIEDVDVEQGGPTSFACRASRAPADGGCYGCVGSGRAPSGDRRPTGARAQISSMLLAFGRRERSMPSSSAAR
jgi:hypothetical protein